jgi:uncharacterized protein YndB with AHSA1/START domain
MTTQKLFKRRVRERMSKTGESYAAARQHIAPARDRVEVLRTSRTDASATSRVEPLATDLASAIELASDERLSEVTGRGWLGWLAILDRWGASVRKHRETVDFLIADHAVPGWWAQAIANGYERARGMRRKHQQPDGFTIYASRTVGVAIDVLFAAFTDERMRTRWLTGGSMALRSSQPGKAARFEWGDRSTRVEVTFEAKGSAKSTAFVAHARLADADAAEAAKSAWRERLAELKSFLESAPPA